MDLMMIPMWNKHFTIRTNTPVAQTGNIGGVVLLIFMFRKEGPPPLRPEYPAFRAP